MRRRWIYGGLLVFFVAASIGFVAPSAAKGKKAKTGWSTKRVEVTLDAGASTTVTVQLTSGEDISGATLVLSDGLSSVVTVSPAGPVDLKANVPVDVTLTLKMPADGVRNYAGNLKVQSGDKAYPKHLQIKIRKPKAKK